MEKNETLRSIKSLVRTNNHTLAYILWCEYIISSSRDPEGELMAEAIKGGLSQVAVEHEKLGYLTAHNDSVRTSLYTQLKAVSELSLSNDDHKQIYQLT